MRTFSLPRNRVVHDLSADHLTSLRPLPASTRGYSICIFLLSIVCIQGCDDSSSASQDRPELAGASGGSSAGEVSGERSGENAGEQAGSLAGEQAGALAGEQAGALAGDFGGTPAGDLGGEPAGEPGGASAGDSGGVSAGDPAGVSAGESAGEEMMGCGAVSDWSPAEQQGAIYLAHFLSSEVIRYRVHQEFPFEDGRFNVGSEVHDAALDGVNDLYAVALNLPQTVELYQVPRDVDYPAGMLPMPALLATIQTTPYTPRRVFFDSARERLFIFTNAPLDGGLLEEMFLFIYDVSDPDAPISLTREPTSLPVSTTLAVEPRAGMLALVDLNALHLMLYDVRGDTPIPLPGDPIDLLSEFPEPGGQEAFQVRNLKFDPLRGRLMLARSQGIASEVITFAYPPIESKGGEIETPEDPESDCQPIPGYESMTRIDDDFEVERPIDERAHLLGGFAAIPMIGEPFVLFISYAWRSTSISSFVTLMSEGDDERLRNLEGCGEYGGFGCFYTSYFSGQPSTYNHLTDGAGCVDQSHRVFAGVGLEDDENSSLFLFSFDRDTGTLSPLLTDRGRNLSTSAYPLDLACH